MGQEKWGEETSGARKLRKVGREKRGEKWGREKLRMWDKKNGATKVGCEK